MKEVIRYCIKMIVDELSGSVVLSVAHDILDIIYLTNELMEQMT